MTRSKHGKTPLPAMDRPGDRDLSKIKAEARDIVARTLGRGIGRKHVPAGAPPPRQASPPAPAPVPAAELADGAEICPGGPPPASLGPDPVAEWRIVTPDMAADWLRTRNRRNRNFRDSLVRAYARDIESGAWVLSHQAIAFDSAGNLVDGQHRLAAIHKTGKALRLLVVWNLPEKQNGRSTLEALDRGAPRSITDNLHLGHGVKDARLVTKIAAVLGQMAAQCPPPRRWTVNQAHRIAELYAPSIRFAIVLASDTKSRTFRSALILGAVAFVHAVRPELAGLVWRRILTGAGLEDGNPLLGLRDWILNRREFTLWTRQSNRAQGIAAILEAIHGQELLLAGEKASGFNSTPSGFAWEFYRDLQADTCRKVLEVYP